MVIEWESISYSKTKAKNKFDILKEMDAESLNKFKVGSTYNQLREDLVDARDRVFENYNLDELDKQGYSLDLGFGIELYKILRNNYNFSLRDASNNDVWRFLQLEIVPDIVHVRWGFNEERFFNNSRRIWLKTIWWYIHLSWNENSELTYQILKDNSTDTVMNLVERPGLGYNLYLYREIMRQYYLESKQNSDPRKLFRKVLILNNARTVSLVPEFTKGDIKKYVSDLYKDV